MDGSIVPHRDLFIVRRWVDGRKSVRVMSKVEEGKKRMVEEDKHTIHKLNSVVQKLNLDLMVLKERKGRARPVLQHFRLVMGGERGWESAFRKWAWRYASGFYAGVEGVGGLERVGDQGWIRVSWVCLWPVAKRG